MPERLTVLAVTPAGRAGRTDDLGLLPEEVAQRTAGSDVGRTARRGSGTSKMDHTWARVRRIGLDAIADTPEAEWIGTPHEAAMRRVRELRAEVERKVREAVDPERLGTALTFLERFGEETRGRPLFIDPMMGAAAVSHNRQTFELLRESIVQRGSIRPGQIGKRLRPDTVSDYIGTLASALGAVTHTDLRSVDVGGRRRRVQKIERTEAPRAHRDRAKRRLGFRARLFEQVVASSFDRRSAEGDFRWTVWLATWSCLMRPGEPGFGKGDKPFNPDRGICISHVLFWSPEVNINSRMACGQSCCPSCRPRTRAARRRGGRPSSVPSWQAASRLIIRCASTHTSCASGGGASARFARRVRNAMVHRTARCARRPLCSRGRAAAHRGRLQMAMQWCGTWLDRSALTPTTSAATAGVSRGDLTSATHSGPSAAQRLFISVADGRLTWRPYMSARHRQSRWRHHG